MNHSAPAPLASRPVPPALLQHPPRRILLCQLRQIGDVLLSTPSVEMLHRRFPEAELHYFTEKKCLPVLQGNPYLHTLWGVDKKKLATLWHEVAFYRSVAATGFDMVIDFQQLPRCRWVVGFSRAPIRLSFTPPWYTRPLYTHWHAEGEGYSAGKKAGILRAIGLEWQGERPRLFLTAEERHAAATMLAEHGLPCTPFTGREQANGPLAPHISAHQPFFITVDATHRRETRCWPAAHYARLMDSIVAQFPGCHFLLPYGPGEEEEVHALRALCQCKEQVVVPSTMLSLRGMAACMTFAAAHLGNCSAPRHMAVALGVPTMTVLGATGTEWTFPSPEHMDMRLGLPCQPCDQNTCPIGIACLNTLLPQQVLPKVLEHMRQFVVAG